MNTCSTCVHWARFDHVAAAPGGLCESGKLITRGFEPEDDRVTMLQADGEGIWTGSQFGCVHWKAKEQWGTLEEAQAAVPSEAVDFQCAIVS